MGVIGPMGTLSCSLDFPASRLQSEEHFCPLTSQRILPTAFPMVLLFLEWMWQGATPLGLTEGSGHRPRTALGPM